MKFPEDDRYRLMSKSDYQDYIRSPEWRQMAEAAKRRVGYRCQLCNRHASELELEVHHRTYERLDKERPDDLTVLCRRCHEAFHGQRSTVLHLGTVVASVTASLLLVSALWWLFLHPGSPSPPPTPTPISRFGAGEEREAYRSFVDYYSKSCWTLLSKDDRHVSERVDKNYGGNATYLEGDMWRFEIRIKRFYYEDDLPGGRYLAPRETTIDARTLPGGMWDACTGVRTEEVDVLVLP
jgi:hypothetical protein